MMRCLLAAALLACGCPHGGGPPHGQAPTVADVVAKLGKARDEMTSFVADSNMDYWLGNQRMKGEVLVMGAVGAKVRFAALSPAGGATMAEMACNGADFVYVDYQNNCALTGPCDERSIAQFFHIDLAPDDFLHLALGTPPVVSNATGTVKWDGKYEKVELHGAEGTQHVTIDDSEGKFDVIDSELVGNDGKTRWSVANADFVTVAGHRVPGKSRFKAPNQQEDLLVEWGNAEDRKVNEQIDAQKFVLQAPNGLPTCGSHAAPAPAPAPPKSGSAGAPSSRPSPVKP